MSMGTRSFVFVLVTLATTLATRTGWADPLQYNGGPFLETFVIYPLYYGNWSQAEIAKQQDYIVNLAAYMSGKNAPANKQPVMKQYGVDEVSVAAAAKAAPHAQTGILTKKDVRDIIARNQNRKNLPAFGDHTLIVVFPAHGFSVDGTECNGCGGYHTSNSVTDFWAVVPADQGPLVIAHEIFESSADPAIDHFRGWDETVDQCDNAPAITLWFGQIAPPIDNMNGGTCSTTGYTSLDEHQIYGATKAEYLAKYNALWPEGWRLYILQSYVVANGDVLYNAVWRVAGKNTGEIQDYGVSYSKFKSDYNTLFPEGWRLYVLQTYVLANGTVLYNAVWRQGNVDEIQVYGSTLADFSAEWKSLEGWRLVILQSYTLPNGTVLFNAVWRRGGSPELDVWGWDYPRYRARYDELFPQDWRLYILDSYVVRDGTVRYNAAWRPATHGEIQVYGWTFTDYDNEYKKLRNEGWRLYSLTTYVLPGDQVRYDAVWRQGTVDRPL
jgi:hypothetical protein